MKDLEQGTQMPTEQAASVGQTAPEEKTAVPTQERQTAAEGTKYCKYCGKEIAKDAVLCIHCGRQVEELGGKAQAPNIVITNTNTNTNTNRNTNTNINPAAMKKAKNKWVAVLLCFFLGFVGAHKFYEGKVGMGILYILTVGLFGIGALVDFIMLLFKPNPYYV